MTKILDQYGQPIDQGKLAEPQTAEIATLENRYLTPMLGGLTPARLQGILRAADQGSLFDQHRLFSDMEERDGHMCAEMGKRKGAIVSLPWDVVPPENANAAEKAATEWVREALKYCADALEDLLLAAMDAVGHGFAPIEQEWRREDGEWLPLFHPRPQEWFQLSADRKAIHLQDGSVNGTQLRPFGWVMHQPAKPKTGYAGRMGLHRTLVWPFIYKAYSLGDFAEFLETYGLPFITGKYNSGASADEKASLFAAVTALGHDARAIMPADMQIELKSVTGGSGESGHLAMMAWADKTESKVILGQTLSADTGSGGGGSYALGKVHNEVRKDILRSDARQVAATITRDVVFPMVMLNRPGISSLRRCPRFVLDIEEPEDLKVYADALPKLVEVGLEVTRDWAHERLRIPRAKEGEAILQTPKRLPTPPSAGNQAALTMLAALSGAGAAMPAPAPAAAINDPVAELVTQLASGAAPHWDTLIAALTAKVNAAGSLSALQADLVEMFGGQPNEQLTALMAAAFALAELKGMADVQGVN